MMLNKTEVQAELIKETKIFHFGTLSMTHESTVYKGLHRVGI